MKKIYILTTIALFALAIAGCKKGFLSQEVNPNTPSVASPQNVLSASQANTVNTSVGGNTTFDYWLGYYAPSGNFVPSGNTETYTFTNASFSTFSTYFSNITNYTYLLQQAAANPAYNNFAAIGKILIAWDYQALVDTYNDVPYTQAENSSKYLFPAYDSGPNIIYPDLFKQLDAAIALINSSASAINPGTSDIIFKGTMANWKKFANTLKLRLAVRESNPALFASLKPTLVTELASTAAEGYLDDVTFASAQPGYLASDVNGGQQSPFYRSNGYSAAGTETGGHQTNRANSFFINFLVSHGNDTLRLKQIYAPTNTKAETAKNPIPAAPNNADHIIGNTFGADATNFTNPNTSAFGPGILLTATSPAPLVTGAEACLLLSEGIYDGLLPGPASSTVLGAAAPAGSAQDYYQRAITANFVVLQVPNAVTAAATYYSQPIADVNWVYSLPTNVPAPPSTGANPFNSIIRAIQTQKYIALFGIGEYEEYNEYRRTAYPNLQGARSAKAGALGTGVVPNRIYFPSTETQTNAAAVAAEPAVNPFSPTSLIFWAQTVQ